MTPSIPEHAAAATAADPAANGAAGGAEGATVHDAPANGDCTVATANDHSGAVHSDEEDEVYQTSYARSAALAKPRRRRGGYGNASSVLEALPAKSGKAGGGAPTKNDASDMHLPGSPLGSMSGNNDDFELLRGLDMDLDEERPSLFVDTQENEEDSDGEGEDGNDTDSAHDNDGTNGSASDAERSEEERPRGRTKRAKQAKEIAAKGSDSEEEEEVPQSEGSGYGFSLGEGRALREAEERGDAEDDEEKDADAVVEAGEEPAKQSSKSDAPSETPTDDGAPAPEETEESMPIGPREPASDAELLRLVDRLFLAVTDKDAITVGDINRKVAEHYGWEADEMKKKSRKPLKKMIKGRLTQLMTGEAKAGEGPDEGVDGEEGEVEVERKSKSKKGQKQKKQKKAAPPSDEEVEEGPFGEDYESAPEENDDNSSDYEEEAPTKQSKKKRGKKKVSFDADSDASEDDDVQPKRKSKKRSSRSKNKGKMAQHLRDRHAQTRKRQLEEARIRREELGHLADDETKKDGGEEAEAAQGEHVSEEDKRRIVDIGLRFDTDRHELQVKRAEEREGLIDLLRAKRLESIEAVEIKVEVKAEGEKAVAEKDAPRLTFGSGSSDAAKEETDANEEKPAEGGGKKKKNMLVLDDDSSDDEESDDDLEIAPPSSKEHDPSAKNDAKPVVKAKVSVEDLLFGTGARRPDPQRASKAKVVDPRAALRSALNAQKVKQGNRMLARALERTVDGHLKKCIETQATRRAEALKLQKRINEMEALRRKAAAENEDLDADRLGVESGAVAEMDEEQALEALGIKKERGGEEDDELAMAEKMGLLEEMGGDVDEEAEDEEAAAGDGEAEARPEINAGGDEVGGDDDNKPADDAPSVSTSPEATSPGSVVTPPRGPEASEEDTTQEALESNDGTPEAEDGVPRTLEMANQGDGSPVDVKAKAGDVAEKESPEAKAVNEEAVSVEAASPSKEDEPAEDDAGEAEAEFEEPPAETGPKKPKNSLWRAELEKEKLREAKQKRLKKKGGGLVEGEAEEEADDDLGIQGLEDFGFTLPEKKNDDDDDAADNELDEDDLDAVVDDVSDGEGDEEAGEVARQKLQRAEEKKRHKEIMRRMREGYDGRRGGIAGGSARGTMRFDQLVAADDIEKAKRLGLANDEEMINSDGEEGGEGEKKKEDGVPDEEEDEAAFLDKMLKDRFLHRDEEEVEEQFTDDEESDDEAAAPTDGGDDAEDREQDRAAKHFAKRARRNRILQEYEGESQFSRSRLIDEDVSTQQDLKIMKTSFSRKRSVEGSNLDLKENNGASKKPKGAASGSDAPKPASSFLASGGSLSVALAASRRGPGRKRKTTFLSGKAASFSRSHSASSSSKSVSLNHVVFVSGESQSATSRQPDSGSNSFLGKSRGKAKKASRAGGSLWSKVCSKNFRAN